MVYWFMWVIRYFIQLRKKKNIWVFIEMKWRSSQLINGISPQVRHDSMSKSFRPLSSCIFCFWLLTAHVLHVFQKCSKLVTCCIRWWHIFVYWKTDFQSILVKFDLRLSLFSLEYMSALSVAENNMDILLEKAHFSHWSHRLGLQVYVYTGYGKIIYALCN